MHNLKSLNFKWIYAVKIKPDTLKFCLKSFVKNIEIINLIKDWKKIKHYLHKLNEFNVLKHSTNKVLKNSCDAWCRCKVDKFKVIFFSLLILIFLNFGGIYLFLKILVAHSQAGLMIKYHLKVWTQRAL